MHLQLARGKCHEQRGSQYRVLNYHANGESMDPSPSEHATLEEARAEVRKRLGVACLDPEARFNGVLREDEWAEYVFCEWIPVEGWRAPTTHDPLYPECGGCVIEEPYDDDKGRRILPIPFGTAEESTT